MPGDHEADDPRGTVGDLIEQIDARVHGAGAFDWLDVARLANEITTVALDAAQSTDD